MALAHRVDADRLRAVLAQVDGQSLRVPCRPSLSRSQLAVAALLSFGLTHDQIAERLGCKRTTVRFFIEEAAQRIPGNLPASARLVVWYRGAAEHILGITPA